MQPTVLIVDDNASDRKLLRYNFDWHGYRILEAVNGREALELAIAEHPGLIISDALMPEMDGFQLLRKVKQLPDLRDIPFIFYSSIYTGDREKELALAMGARAFIVKPLAPDQFWLEVSRIILEYVPPGLIQGTVSPSDEEFLAEYSRIVATKLEEKTQKLEEANRKISLTESRYRNLFTSMRDVVVIADLSRTIIDINPPALRTVFGYEPDEVIGKSTSVLYADRDQYELAGREVFNRHDAEAAKMLEIRFQRKSGEVFDGEVFALKMTGDDGKPAGNFGIIRDITERKRAAEALAGSEAEYRRLSQEFHGLLDAIPDSLMLLDRELTVLWTNRAAAEALGTTPEEMADRNCHSLWYGRATPCDICPVLTCFESGAPSNGVITSNDGRVLDIRTVPLTDETGRVTAVINVKRDITEQRKLEAQYLHAQKMESVGTLAGGVAHDFNNILTVIIGMGQIMLMKMPHDDPFRREMGIILEAAERASHLTRELLLFSRKQPSVRRNVDLNQVVGRMETFLHRIIGADIVLKKVSHGTLLPILADMSQLEQVMMNLAVNARDAMPHGGELLLKTEQVTLQDEFVTTHGYGKAGEYALLSITDTGAGMDRQTQQRIFEPFFSTKEVGKGTGLGLAVVYAIIKQHEGFINVYSEPGHGSTFKIYLPLTDQARQEIAINQEQPVAGGTETILLAEDDELVRNLVVSVLSEAGYSVIAAVNGEEAVQKFREHDGTIDLLLLDLIMPRMNGKEAFDEIRRSKPGIKTIFSSGYAADIAMEKASLDETSHLMSKPIAPRDLLKMVRNVLDAPPV